MQLCLSVFVSGDVATARRLLALKERFRDLERAGSEHHLDRLRSGMVESIEQYNGTVDKFVGDEVMALFGAPLHDNQHPLNALLCNGDAQACYETEIQRQQRADDSSHFHCHCSPCLISRA